MSDDHKEVEPPATPDDEKVDENPAQPEINRAGATYYQREVIFDRPREEVEGIPSKDGEGPQFDVNESTDSRLNDPGFSGQEKQTTVFSCQVDHLGTVVNGRGWISVGSDKPPVVIMHDLGQDLRMYRFAAHRLVEAGFSTYAFDLRGHGRSGRRLGHIPKFDLLVKDLLQVVAWVRKKEMGRSPIVVGQGVGALIAGHFQKSFSHYCKGVVLLSPCFHLRSPLSSSARLMIKAIAEVTPKVRLPALLTPKFSSNVFDDKTSILQNLTRQAYPGITANFAYELIEAMDAVTPALKKVTVPLLVMTPQNDPVCDYKKIDSWILESEFCSHIELDVEGHQILTRSKEDLEGIFAHLLPWLNKIL